MSSLVTEETSSHQGIGRVVTLAVCGMERKVLNVLWSIARVFLMYCVGVGLFIGIIFNVQNSELTLELIKQVNFLN